MQVLRKIALAAAAALTTLAVAVPQQELTNGELQRFIYQPNYPTVCGAAAQAAREMRVKPTTEPAFLHRVMKANITECAATQWAEQHPPLWNTAVFGAAAAALLASRHEPPGEALRDARHAKDWAEDLMGYVHQPGAGMPGPGKNIPSMYRTDAGRIHRDALAIISSIQGSGEAASAGGDGLPRHLQGPGSTPTPPGE